MGFGRLGPWSRSFYTRSLWGKNLTNFFYPSASYQAPQRLPPRRGAPDFGITLGGSSDRNGADADLDEVIDSSRLGRFRIS